MKKNILITGASSGFGKLMTSALLKEGHAVVASMRNSTTKNKASADMLQAAGAHIVDIDVTSDDSVNAGVSVAIRILGGLDVVVNNAGYGVIGLQEQFTPGDFQKLFDVNVFGVQRVNRAVLPHMRSKEQGLIIYVTSVLGRMVMPFYGPYNASKWALEAMAENYKVELAGLGIDQCIVEPGGFPTGFFDSLVRPSDRSEDQSYGALVEAPKQFFDNFEGALASNPVQKPELVADAIAGLVKTPAGKRPFRTVVDKMGMGDHVGPYNDHLEKLTHGIYQAFGMGGMLELKTS